jgi:hypothetical protein
MPGAAPFMHPVPSVAWHRQENRQRTVAETFAQSNKSTSVYPTPEYVPSLPPSGEIVSDHARGMPANDRMQAITKLSWLFQAWDFDEPVRFTKLFVDDWPRILCICAPDDDHLEQHVLVLLTFQPRVTNWTKCRSR